MRLEVKDCLSFEFYQHHYSHSQEDDIRITKLNENVCE